jgi:hypothetical protein
MDDDTKKQLAELFKEMFAGYIREVPKPSKVQIKIIIGFSLKDMEERVNAFLEENSDKIIFPIQYKYPSNENYNDYVATITYRK